MIGHWITGLGIFLLILNRIARPMDGPDQQRFTTRLGLFMMVSGEAVATMGSW